MSTPNNNPKGIVYILIAMMVFSVQDGIMKHIYNFVSLYDSSYVEVLAFLSSQPSKLFFSLFLISMFFYSALSISEVFEQFPCTTVQE